MYMNVDNSAYAGFFDSYAVSLEQCNNFPSRVFAHLGKYRWIFFI